LRSLMPILSVVPTGEGIEKQSTDPDIQRLGW
jgi:hypothetical protein